MRVLAAVVVLAGCGFQPRAATSAGDAQHGDSASGDARRIDAMIDSPTDSDGDGIPDAIDNCPTMANADQRDHDIDGRGDVCDLCPHIFEASDVDTDSDGVGDACDPRPTMPGDTRMLWVGFYDATDIAGWTTAGTWTVSLGKLTGGATDQGLLYAYPIMSFQHAFAQTSVHLTALAAPTNSVSPAPLLYTGDAGFGQYYLCEPALTKSGKEIDAVDVYPGQNHVDPQPWPGTLAAGSDLMITDQVTGGSHTCKVTQGTAVAQSSQNAGASTGVVSLGAAYAALSFDYLFVVEIGQ